MKHNFPAEYDCGVKRAIGISGIHGLVGSSIAEYAVSQGLETYEIDFRINLLPRPGDVIVFASGDPRKFWAQENPKEFYFKEIQKALEIFSYCKNDNKVVLISTTELNTFEVQLGSKLEPNSSNSSPKRDFSTYATAKLLIELLCKDLLKDFFIARLCGILSHRAKKGTIHDLIFQGKSWISPNSRLQVISDKNLARYILDAAVKKDGIGTFNVVPTGYVYWQEIIDQAKQPLKFQKNCDPTTLIVSNLQLQKLLDYKIDSCSVELDGFFKNAKG